jgi:hypothetical protein
MPQVEFKANQLESISQGQYQSIYMPGFAYKIICYDRPMQLVYSSLGKRLPSFSKQLTVAVGLLVFPITMWTEKRPPSVQPIPAKRLEPVSPDPRTVRLKKFFTKLHCPVFDMADEFVQAADDNRLDWRLLPSISVIESGGGKAYRNNNIFGWNQGLQMFPTIRAGIHEVAFKLAKSPLYQNRDLLGKLRLYNPNESYPGAVLTVMNRISPTVNLQPVRKLEQYPHEFEYTRN